MNERMNEERERYENKQRYKHIKRAEDVISRFNIWTAVLFIAMLFGGIALSNQCS